MATGAWIFCFSVGGGALGATLITIVKTLQRAGHADERGMERRGGPGTGTPQVHHQALPFSPREIRSMGEKSQWTVLPYSVAKRLPGLRLSLTGLKVERYRRPHCIVDYSYYKTNAKTLPVACLSAMHCGRALDRLLREICFAYPALGPVYTKGRRIRRFLPYWNTTGRRAQARPYLTKRRR